MRFWTYPDKMTGSGAGALMAAALMISLLLFPRAACADTKIQIYYLDEDGLGLYPVEYTEDLGGAEDAVETFLDLIIEKPAKEACMCLLPDDVRILDYSLDEELLTLVFSASYEEMDSIREVLARAGIVRTFVQIEGISAVRFTVDGRDALSPDGVSLGIMNANTFVEDSGRQINAITHTEINLYFTDKTGTYLQKEARSIYYSASKPLEWAIVERLIAGPKVEGNYATLPSNTQIISVISSNSICYVNLNRTFIAEALNIDEEIPVYSIVNSIIEDCRDIEEVQISVEGDSNLIFRENMDLSHPYEADYSYSGQE